MRHASAQSKGTGIRRATHAGALLVLLALGWTALSAHGAVAAKREGGMPLGAVVLGLGNLFGGRSSNRRRAGTVAEREELARLADGNPTPALQIDALGEVRFANPAARHFLAGLTHDPALREEWRKACRAMWATRGEERRFRFADRCYLLRSSGRAEADGLNIYALDVSDHDAWEQALIENEARLSLAARSARLGLFEIDVPTRRVTYDEMCAWQVGLSPKKAEETLELWAERIHPDDRAKTFVAIEDLTSGRSGQFQSEFRLNDGRGDWLWVSATAEVVAIDSSGLPRRVIGSQVDVTALKRSAAALDLLNRRNLAQLDLVALAETGTDEAVLRKATEHAARLTGSPNAALTVKQRESGLSGDAFRLGEALPDPSHPNREQCVAEIRDGGVEVATLAVSGKAQPYLAEDQLTLQLVGAEAWRLVQRIHQARKLQVQSRVLESAVNGVAIADSRGFVEWTNPAFERMTGYTLSEIEGRNFSFLKSNKHPAAFYTELWRTIAAGKSFASEFINRRKDGVEIIVDQVITPVLTEDGKIDKYIAVCQDITERKSAEHRLNFLAEHDELTGVLNRATVIAAVNQEIAESDRSGNGFAIHYIGLDHFTVVNDRLGRHAGDAVLRRVAQTLSGCLRPSDSVARCGGDEFAVLQRMTGGPDDAAALARRLLGALSTASDHPDAELRIAASIGISVFPGDQGTAEALLMNAELAMRRAKTEIRGSLRFFTPALHEAAVTKATLATALPAAMRDRQIFLAYQPIVDLQTGGIVGCEALARWRHPTLGLLPPGQFIQIAEETGQIRDLGLYILDRAIGEFSTAMEDGGDDVTLSVNLSFGQFAEEELVDVIRDELARTRFPASRLELELTESMLAQEPERAIDMTRAVSDLGCKLAIDDFGTGYSSLAQLRRFKVDFLKIDRTFVMDIANGEGPQGVVRAAIAMGHSLGLQIIAEGVETVEQAEFLRRENVELAQGYLFGKPMPIADLAELHRQQKAGRTDVAAQGRGASPYPGSTKLH
jgi:diguanylate cyclase (GGDEF)-like protein/PAS domain S-box-containing protein